MQQTLEMGNKLLYYYFVGNITTKNRSNNDHHFCHCFTVYKAEQVWQPLRRIVWRFSKTVNIELPNDPAIPFLGRYQEKVIIEKTHSSQYSEQHCLKYPGHGSNVNVHQQTEECIMKIWYIYTAEF